ncbi:MAG: hypothetical protein ACREOI_30710, partial [bacterium]
MDGILGEGYMRASQLFLAFAMTAMAFCLFVSGASAQPATLRSDAWMANGGAVNAIVHNNGITYIGGEFTSVSMPTGIGVMLSTRPTALPFLLPKIIKSNTPPLIATPVINAVVSDGAGGWYVGGNFNRVENDSVGYKHLIHIFANDSLDLAWKPNPDKQVFALALHGDRLYVGGEFENIGVPPQSIRFLAALHAATGEVVTEWNPKAGGGTVRALAVDALAVDGPIIYAGGSFTNIDIDRRNRIAAIKSVDGKATKWNPDISGTQVNTIALAGTTVYAGGNFTSVGAESRNHIAAINAVTGNPFLSWNPHVSGVTTSTQTSVQAVIVSGSTVYIGGNFSTISLPSMPSIPPISRSNLAALKVTTGEATGWRPVASDPVNALAISGSTIYAG